MPRSTRRTSLSPALTAYLLLARPMSAIAAPPEPVDAVPTLIAGDPGLELGTAAHILPVRAPGTPSPAQGGLSPKLAYYGGPVIANVRVITLFWGSHTRFQGELDQFYADITQSPHLAWL